MAVIGHTIATAAVVLGVTGTLAMAGYWAAVHLVDPRVVPAHLATRVLWWNNRVSPMLQASIVLAIGGIIGLFGS